MFAEFLKGVGQERTEFSTGSIVEGTVSAVKGDDVFVDIGYKSEGIVGIDEFADPVDRSADAAARPSHMWRAGGAHDGRVRGVGPGADYIMS